MDPEALAALHARCFDAAPPPWSAQAFAGALAAPGTFLVGDAAGFALGRTAGPEAELLTVAVAPERRRDGRGRALLLAYEAAAAARGADESFLEVAATNAPARALYASAGYVEAGRRRGYYSTAGGAAVDALVLRKALLPTRSGNREPRRESD